jgi:cellulose synthase/poly-beta-1,6-N-acetylglucosamine synthase-like glycosyltransferase
MGKERAGQLMQKKLCRSSVMVKSIRYPSLSIIVPVYNMEKQVSKCIISLFKSVEQYPNFCEIMVVDDGSSDYTYEIAWATIQKCRRQQPKIKGKVIRNSAAIGKTEAVRTVVDRAFGELIITVGCGAFLKLGAIKEIVKRYYAGEHGWEMEKAIKVFPNPWF